MSALRPLVILAVAAATLAVGASADAKAPPVVTHTFQVQYTLTGDYSARTVYTDTVDGFCPGTGYVEDASFSLTIAAKLKVKLQGSGQASKTTLASTDPGTWKQQGTTISMGDPCEAVKSVSCAGSLTLGPSDTTSNTVYAIGRRKQIVFAGALSDVPREVSQASDCNPGGDVYPVIGFSLHDALAPYEQVSYPVSLVALAKLGKGKSVSGRAKPTAYPDGYDVSTCSGSSPCTGSFSKLTSTIRVKRVD